MGSSSVASEETIDHAMPAAGAGGGGGKHHHHHHFHIHFPHLDLFHHHHGGEPKKGSVAIIVGEEQQRFVIPVIYINHPLFVGLLKSAEEEFDFHYQKGPITIPCHVEEFRSVQGLIDRENSLHHHHHHVLCFWV